MKGGDLKPVSRCSSLSGLVPEKRVKIVGCRERQPIDFDLAITRERSIRSRGGHCGSATRICRTTANRRGESKRGKSSGARRKFGTPTDADAIADRRTSGRVGVPVFSRELAELAGSSGGDMKATCVRDVACRMRMPVRAGWVLRSRVNSRKLRKFNGAGRYRIETLGERKESAISRQ